MGNEITKFGSNTTFTLTQDLSVQKDDAWGPFNRFPGFTFSTVTMSREPLHAGERHPDGDEIVYVVSGRIEVAIEAGGERVVQVGAGEGVVVPRGLWHRVRVLELGQLVTVSPGPGFEFRPLERP